MVGYIGIDDQAANILMQSFLCIFFQIPFGFHMSVCAMVGKEVGNNDPTKAKNIFKFIFTFSMVFNILELMILYHFRFSLVNVFTKN